MELHASGGGVIAVFGRWSGARACPCSLKYPWAHVPVVIPLEALIRDVLGRMLRIWCWHLVFPCVLASCPYAGFAADSLIRRIADPQVRCHVPQRERGNELCPPYDHVECSILCGVFHR